MTQLWILTSFLALLCAVTGATCQEYLNDIVSNISDKSQVIQLMAPFMILSGKSLEDLGFPEGCQQHPSLAYTTIEFRVPEDDYQKTTYYGLCFPKQCNSTDLNENSQQIVSMLKIYSSIPIPENIQMYAVTPQLDRQMSGASIAIIVVFCALIGVQMGYSVKKWVLQCLHQEDVQQRYTLEDGQLYQEEEMTFLRKVSLEYKMNQLSSKPEKTNKLISFSVFKILCVPLMVLGQEFYFRNFAAYNYFSFNQEIYQTFYSKVAVFSVYLPDVLFFISAYLLTIKCLQSTPTFKFLASQFVKKIIRLYPIYLAVVLIYWLISPSLHSGPVWYVYKNQAAVCNTSWWASLLLIDNWFSNNCYGGAWFVQAQLQFVLFCLMLFFLYGKSKMAGIALYVVSLVTMMVLTSVLSSMMPISVQVATSHSFKDFYISSYGHFMFYLLGMGMAFVRNVEKLSQKVGEILETKKFVEIILFGLGLIVILLVLFRPSIWAGGSKFQFALSRFGVVFGFLMFFVGGIFKPEDQENSSMCHRLAYYSYPIMLVSSVVTLSSVWGESSFNYVNGLNLLNMMVTESIISVLVGTSIGILLEPNMIQK